MKQMEYGKEEKYIKFKGHHVFTLFPKSPSVLGENGANYGITKWRINEVLEGELHEDCRWMSEITVTGNFYFPLKPDVEYTVLAKENEHKTYGMQYVVLHVFEDVDFSKMDNQIAFLKEFLSEQQIEDLYKVYEDPLSVIAEHDVEKLVKVRNIGYKYAEAILRRFDSKRDLATIFIALDGLGLTSNFISKLMNTYKSASKVINIVKGKPYDLIFDIEGVGFKTADSIALKGGIEPKSPDRIRGFIYYLLKTKAEEGNSFLYASELTEEIFTEFGGKNEILENYYDEDGNIIGNNISKAMEQLVSSGLVVKEEEGEKLYRKVYLKQYYELEQAIATHLKRLLLAPNNFKYNNWEEEIKKQEEAQGWNFTNEQKDGIKLGLDKQVCFITGLGGTGKSSLVSGILSVLRHYNFAQCSLSGKAAARLKEVTGKDGSTIHRLLGYRPGLGFSFNKDNPLHYDIIIVDEVSLIGGEIFLSLLEAIPNGAKLFILGDMGQLESIGCMNLAADLYHSDIVPKKELTIIHRQAQKSGIITSSHAVRRGEQLFNSSFEGTQVIGELQDMIIDVVDKDKIMATTLNYFEEYYQKVNENIMDIQLISPVKERGDSCVYCLNQEIQSRINPQRINEREIVINLSEDKSFCIRKNDKVLCTKNIYGIKTTEQTETDIFNGWTGIVKKITEDNQVVIYFPLAEEEVILNSGEIYESITLGYAITCHKMQGASAKVIIGVLDFSTPPKMLTKELLYTMITRAEKMGIIIGQNRAIAKAIENSGISNKKTFLQDLLVFTDEDYEAQKDRTNKKNKILETLLEEENVPSTLLTIEDILNNH
jgi:exodeoxyribonuclease V alpha subunit